MALEMNMHRKSKLLLGLMWLLEGMAVGFGAILPGVSGGTLCVVFGVYRPIIETLANVRSGIRKHGFMLAIFLLGVAVGFVGLSGVAAILLEKNAVFVTCAFIGFIVGTFPDLWKDAGAEGRTKRSLFTLGICFLWMLGILAVLKTQMSVAVDAGVGGYLLCGLLWGLSFIVPGLSSSSLLLFFGLYQPMLAGISGLDLAVLIPMGIGMAACLLLLSKAMGYAYQNHYATVSHGVLGIVAATAVMLLPDQVASLWSGIIYGLLILGGAAVSFGLSCVCNKLKAKYSQTEK